MMEEVRTEMLKNWKTAWNNYVNILTAMHDQGEKMFDLYCSQSNTMRSEVKKLFSEGLKNIQDAQTAYMKAIEDNLKKFEETASQYKV
jgi:hypothetical protein